MRQMICKNRKNGFALIYAILLSGAVLVVGVILMNIITKQLVFSSINRNSETSYYYAANSGRECLNYYAGVKPQTFYIIKKDDIEFSPTVNFSCFGQEITMVESTPVGPKHSYSLENSTPVDLDGNKVELFVTFNTNCINGLPTCTGPYLEDKSVAVMKAIGYAGVASRQTKRVAIQVKK